MNALNPPTLDALLAGWFQWRTLYELAAVVLCAAMAWLLASVLRRALGASDERSILFGQKLLDGVLFPLALLCLVFAAKVALGHWFTPLLLLKLAVPVCLSLLAIRVAAQVLQAAFKESPLIRFVEQSISWVAWIAVALWLSGLLPLMLDELDQIHWKIGNSSLTVRNLLEGALTACAVLLLTLWISAAIETRLLRSATGGELSLRKAVSNATRAFLMFFGLLFALSAVGIDLTALSVLGGAVGVGVGFGLQKLAANYVSGFVILAERSMRIGDNVRVDGFEGIITAINARYSVIRSLTGRESIVPNELLITSRVENLSLADSKVLHTLTVTVGYDSDTAVVMRLLLEAAAVPNRVLSDPAPEALLSAFHADGMEFTLLFWLGDPQKGQLGPRSEINLELLRLFRANGIDIPYPQRVVHVRSA